MQEETRVAAEGLCRMYNPCLLSPKNQGTRCCAGPNVQEEFVLFGLSPLSCQGVLVPFQMLPLASEQGWLCPWLCGQWGQLRIPPGSLCDKIPGCRLSPSLVSHGWIPGFVLAGCPGDGWAQFPSLPHFPALTLPCVRAALPQRCCNQGFPPPTISRQTALKRNMATLIKVTLKWLNRT